MKEWKEYKLGDLLEVKYGKDYKMLSDGDIAMYGSGGLMKYVNKALYTKPSILIPRKGSLNNIMYVDKPFWTVDTMFWTIVNEEKVDIKCLYYKLCKIDFASLNVGSAIPSMTVPVLNEFRIKLPSLPTQKKIADILSSLDSKIETNRAICSRLEELAQAIFKSWFIDFEPFGGSMPEDWKIGNLLDVAELFDSMRKPLSSLERASRESIYPYYGATSVMDYVDEYIFDGVYLLMGEDGSVIDENGYPYLQYVSGKFWPNNHAHVMQGKNGFSTEMLHCFLLHKNIKSFITGAVQAKLSQANMRKINITIPSETVCQNFNKIIKPLYMKRINVELENKKLSSLRDTLLPRLMSGEIEPKDIRL